MIVYSVELKNGKLLCNGNCSPFVGEIAEDGLYSLYSEYLGRTYYVRVEDILVIEAEPAQGKLMSIIKDLEKGLEQAGEKNEHI